MAEAWGAEVPPAPHHVEELLAFGGTWNADAPMLVHCWAGISRSMAAAYILLCDCSGPASRRRSRSACAPLAPHAFPNPLLVSLPTKTLGATAA